MKCAIWNTIQFDAPGTMVIVAHFIERKLAEHGNSKVIPEAAPCQPKFDFRFGRAVPLQCLADLSGPTCQGLGCTDVGLCSKSGGKADVPRGRICTTPVIENSEPNFREGVLGWTAPDGIDCARMGSLQISNKGDRPWNRLAELAWIHRNIFSSFMG